MTRRQLMLAAAGAGIAAGVAYAFSPLTVLCVPVIVAMSYWASRDLDPAERRWFYSLIGIAVTLRLLIIAALFLSSDGRMPFETFFGDELFFKNRSVWIRNIGLDVPISPADVIYAFEDVGISSYLYALAFVQAVAGKAPYGVHVLNSACYLTGALLLFRIVRRSFGGVAAFAGLSVLLFTPTLMMWSISALKEPSYTLAAAIEFACALQVARAPGLGRKALWLLGVIAGAIALESIRRGGSMVALAGVSAGYLFGYVLPRPRLLLATIAVLPFIVAATLWAPPIQSRALAAVRTGAFYHTGHVLSPGHSYHSLHSDYYRDGLRIYQMPARDAVDYLFWSYVAYVTEPVPWRIESRALLAYLPEQMLWFLLLALVPFGIAEGVRRDPMLTMLLVAHGLGAITVVAVSSGNIGTLIRHRGLLMPYMVWLAGLGLYQLVNIAVTSSPPALTGGLHAHGRS